MKYLLLYFEQTYGLTSEKKMTAALSIVANENFYHPAGVVMPNKLAVWLSAGMVATWLPGLLPGILRSGYGKSL